MNQFVIDMTGSRSGTPSGFAAGGESRSSPAARGPVRSPWPFLVHASLPTGTSQGQQQSSYSPPGFAS